MEEAYREFGPLAERRGLVVPKPTKILAKGRAFAAR